MGGVPKTYAFISNSRWGLLVDFLALLIEETLEAKTLTHLS